MTATAFCSLSLNSTLVLACLDRNSRTLSEFRNSQDFNINILSWEQEHLSRRFSSRGTGERSLDGIKFRLTDSGLPVFEGAAATLECKCVELVEGGDHVIVVGEVKNAAIRGEVEPLIYFRGAYRRLAALEE